jgi:hypothetical protein
MTMAGGNGSTRSPSRTHRGRRRFRAAATPWFVAALAAALVGGGRVPSQNVLADGPTPSNPVADSGTEQPVTEPEGFQIPGASDVRAPASVSANGTPASALGAQSIPEVALAAYQRAAVVIDTADLSCRLDWTLLAGIGQVESDHGQVGGSHLNSHGVAHPAIIGPRLDGTHGTSVVRDTDAGHLDGDKHFDRAVGPMQFLPSTWAVVAVDGDDDGKRNVEDIDDAALGSAVYLCAGNGDLSTKAGAEAALLRYNHSKAYVAKVMGIVDALRLSSVFTAVDTRPTTTTQVVAFPHLPHQAPVGSNPSAPPTSQPTSNPHPTIDPGPIGDPVPPGPTSSPTSSPTSDPTSDPTSTPTDDPTSSPTSSPSSDPTSTPTDDPTDTPSPSEPPIIPDPVPDALAGLTPDQIQALDDGWLACVGTLPVDWTLDQMQTCLADELAVPADDPTLQTFLQWVLDQGLVPGREQPSATP